MFRLLFALPKGLILLLLKLVISPVTVFLVVWFATGVRREAYLMALLYYTAFTTLFLSWQLLSRSSLSRLLGFILKSAEAILFIAMLIIYWSAYLLIWGRNFGLVETFAILK